MDFEKIERPIPKEGLPFNYFLAYREAELAGNTPDNTNIEFEHSEGEGELASLIADPDDGNKKTLIKLLPGYIYKAMGQAGFELSGTGYLFRGLKFYKKNENRTYTLLGGSPGFSYVGTNSGAIDNDSPAICYIKVEDNPIEVALRTYFIDGISLHLLAGSYVNIEAIKKI